MANIEHIIESRLSELTEKKNLEDVFFDVYAERAGEAV